MFVVTHRPKAPVVKEGGTTYTFVTDGLDATLARAREAAGDRDVVVLGGADVIQQCLKATSWTSSTFTSRTSCSAE